MQLACVARHISDVAHSVATPFAYDCNPVGCQPFLEFKAVGTSTCSIQAARSLHKAQMAVTQS